MSTLLEIPVDGPTASLALKFGLVVVATLARVVIASILVPVFGLNRATRFVVGLTLALALEPFVAQQSMQLLLMDAPQLVVLIVREALVGVALGVSFQVLVAVARMAGGMIDSMIPGWRVSSFASAGSTGPVAAIYTLTFIVVVVVLDGHVLVFEQLAYSYRWIPVGQGQAPQLVQLLDGAALIFAVALSVSVPLILVTALVEILFAMASRFSRGAPSENLLRGWLVLVFVFVTLFETTHLLATWFFESLEVFSG